MIALVRYLLSLLLRGQGWLPPIVLYGSAMVVLTTNDLGPLPQTYSACAMIAFVCLPWLTAVLVNAEDRDQRAMTIVTAGGLRRVVVGNLLAALALCAALTVVGEVYPLYAGRHTVTVPALAVGVLAQLTCGLTGIAVGLPCSRLVIRRTGYAVLLGLLLLGVLTLVRVLPPIAPMLRLLVSDETPAGMLAPLAVLLLVSVGLLLASAAATYLIALRQE